MPASAVRCLVLGAHVARITDFEGEPVTIICPEYEESSGACRLKMNALDEGPLLRVLERAKGSTLGGRETRCDFM